MTDTVSPITEPHLTPMFATGAQPVQTTNTEPHPAPIFDTGPHPDPLPAIASEPGAEPDADADSVAEAAAALGVEPPAAHAFSESDNVDTDAFLRSVTPVAVPSSFAFLKRWTFAVIVAGVWLVAAAAGLGFYYWWYTALHKTLPVFGILLYLVVCMVASVLVSLVPDRPRVTALAVALMSAPLASMAAAAVLHGAYYFEWIARPLVG